MVDARVPACMSEARSHNAGGCESGCPLEFCSSRLSGYSTLHSVQGRSAGMVDEAETQRPAATVWEEAETALSAWHAAHPAASFADLEAAVEEHVNRLRTQL